MIASLFGDIFGVLLLYGNNLTVLANSLCSFFYDIHVVTPIVLWRYS